jgi:hypothetical protein
MNNQKTGSGEFKGYGPLVLTQTLILLAYPFLVQFPGLRVISAFMFVLVLLAAMRLVARKRRQLYIAGTFALIGITGFIGDMLFPAFTSHVAFLLGFVLFLTFTSSLMLVDILLRNKHVDADLIYGAIGIYLMIGLAFAFAFALLETIIPGSFSGLQELISAHATTDPMIYFSYVTLTTLGYGDISPISSIAMSMSYLEAIFGQLFLAILIARLVGMHIAAGNDH